MYKDDIASQKDLQEASEVAISSLIFQDTEEQLYSYRQYDHSIKAPADGYVISKNISKGMCYRREVISSYHF
jgi:cobalt-zinc-cadmium efflux system membrane fusion protein